MNNTQIWDIGIVKTVKNKWCLYTSIGDFAGVYYVLLLQILPVAVAGYYPSTIHIHEWRSCYSGRIGFLFQKSTHPSILHHFHQEWWFCNSKGWIQLIRYLQAKYLINHIIRFLLSFKKEIVELSIKRESYNAQLKTIVHKQHSHKQQLFVCLSFLPKFISRVWLSIPN